MTRFLLLFGGGIFVLLGALHAICTVRDERHPRRLVPEDPAVREAMLGTGLRLTRGGTTMWRAWLGFNLSHGLGVVLFGGLTMALGNAWTEPDPPRFILLFPLGVGLLYLVLSVRYWFRISTAGIALATACFAAAWILA
ncbi:MAG: LIC_13387 family protein [Gemmatimonadales bacterium]